MAYEHTVFETGDSKVTYREGIFALRRYNPLKCTWEVVGVNSTMPYRSLLIDEPDAVLGRHFRAK